MQDPHHGKKPGMHTICIPSPSFLFLIFILLLFSMCQWVQRNQFASCYLNSPPLFSMICTEQFRKSIVHTHLLTIFSKNTSFSGEKTQMIRGYISDIVSHVQGNRAHCAYVPGATETHRDCKKMI